MEKHAAAPGVMRLAHDTVWHGRTGLGDRFLAGAVAARRAH
jgi:hypothetical protein